MCRGHMICHGLPCGLSSLMCLVRFDAYRFLPFVIPLDVGNTLLSRKPYVFGY